VHVRSLLAGIGIAAVAVTVPLVVISSASADPAPSGSTTTSTSTTCPRQSVHQEVQQYLSAHPDVAAEMKTIQALPQDQRAAARKQYLAAHSDVAAQLKTFRQDRRGAWAEATGARTAELDKYPAVKALDEDLANTPAGQRAAEAKKYLAAHSDARTQLKQLRADQRSSAQACKATK
jgi:hemophore-related protein